MWTSLLAFGGFIAFFMLGLALGQRAEQFYARGSMENARAKVESEARDILANDAAGLAMVIAAIGYLEALYTMEQTCGRPCRTPRAERRTFAKRARESAPYRSAK